MPSFQVLVLGSLFVSFHPSLIRFPQLFLRCFPYALALGIFRFPSASFRPLLFRLRLLSLLFLPFRTSRLRLTVASPVRRFHSRFHGFPRSSRPGFPCLASGSRTRLAVCFLSSLPASLPQLFHRCFPSAFASGLFRLPSGFFRPLRPASDYSAIRLSFPLFPISPDGGSLGARPFLSSLSLSSDLRLVSKPSSRFWYSASCDFLSPLAVSCHRHYTAAGLLFPARPPP